MTRVLLVLAAALLTLPGPAEGKEPASSHGSQARTISPAEALQALREGNRRYVEGRSRNPHHAPTDRTRLASGQHPPAIVLTCADSRVPPELVFDQGLGDIFTVRVAGNVVDENEIASIEYAVEHLGARLVVVMGHESCGAVHAAITTPAGRSAGSESLDALVAEIRGCIGEEKLATLDRGDPTNREAAHANVAGVIAKLRRQSPVVAAAVERGQVEVVAALYALESGEVTFR